MPTTIPVTSIAIGQIKFWHAHAARIRESPAIVSDIE
jgi:hypothetical protein